jgi:hypothetical protein
VETLFTARDVMAAAGCSKSTAIRAIKRAVPSPTMIGQNLCLTKSQFRRAVKAVHPVRGNPRWIESWEAAAEDGAKGATAARLSRCGENGKRGERAAD